MAPKDSAPACRGMGAHCDALRVVLRVATLDDAGEGRDSSADHEATWLLGHTERITFLGDLRRDGDDLFMEAVIQVPCRFLDGKTGGREDGKGCAGVGSHCLAHGYTRASPPRGPDPAEPRRFPGERFQIVERGKAVTRRLQPYPRPPRELPIHAGSNPCVGAPCRTADNRRGAACCRDLQVEIMCTEAQHHLEDLVFARKSPYLCKVERTSPFSLGAEMISACGFLLDDGVHCSLHGRLRPDGRPAKPDLCSEWPEPGDTLHPGCVFAPHVQALSRASVLKSVGYAAARR